jgi:hypothetical protein
MGRVAQRWRRRRGRGRQAGCPAICNSNYPDLVHPVYNWPDLIDIQLSLDGEHIIAHLVALEQGVAHILGQIELLIVQFDAEEFPAFAHLHISVSACDLLTNFKNPRFHLISPH